MATSSIFARFNIKDKKTASAFVEALEKSAAGPAWKPRRPVNPPLTDPDAIRKLVEKNEQLND